MPKREMRCPHKDKISDCAGCMAELNAMTPKDNDELRELDDIMEDLMVGHNFEYARKALMEWHTTYTLRALERICSNPVGEKCCSTHAELYNEIQRLRQKSQKEGE